MEEHLKRFLPKGGYYGVLHIQSTPKETHPLVSQEVVSNDIKTVKIEHFITISSNELIFFAIEIFIYITIDYKNEKVETLLFVSKADTNGQNDSKVKIHLITSEIIKYLLNLSNDNYLNKVIPKEIESKDPNSITKSTSTKRALNILINRLKGEPVPDQIKPYSIEIPDNFSHINKIALFTRPEPQYLFPESGKNPNKHILSGDQLLNWWLKIFDKILIESFIEETSAKVRIPAEESTTVQRHLIPLKFKNWKVGDIFSSIDENKLAVYHIPLFPDDPKTRFLEHLVVEGRIRSISLKQFWNELQIRQEFRLGVTVSVIGIEGRLKPTNGEFNHGLNLRHKYFKNVKTYVTGEDYSNDEGAFESLSNVSDYLKYRFNYKIPKIVGEFIETVKVVETKRPLEINSLNTTLIRKKPKK